MKKHLFVILMLLMSSSVYAQSTFSRYDINRDGKETIEDVTLLTNRLLGKTNYPVTSITLTASNTFLRKAGETCSLTATVLPTDADNTSVNWSSSDESIATVEDGVVTAIGGGTATITATAIDGSGINATCKITVATNPLDAREYVDLGLPSGLLWATCNVGADSPEEYGNYYAWGETKMTSSHSWENYLSDLGGKFGSNANYGKDYYDPLESYYKIGAENFCRATVAGVSETISGTEYDAARKLWGGRWRMPTREEMLELINNCESEWTNDYNNTKVSGIIFKKNGSSIFFPAAGYYDDRSFEGKGSTCNYQTATLFDESYDNSKILYASNNSEPTADGYARKYLGLVIRPVWNPTTDIDRPQKDFQGVLNGHEWIDLGLKKSDLKNSTIEANSEDDRRTVFATTNLGTIHPYESGNYFRWGELEGWSLTLNDDQTINKATQIDKYGNSKSTSLSSGFISSNYELDSSSLKSTNDIQGDIFEIDNIQYGDAATYNWGEGWIMWDKYFAYTLSGNTYPSTVQIGNCTWEITDYQLKKNGYTYNAIKITNKDHHTAIVLPMAGYARESERRGYGTYGAYNTISLYKYNSSVRVVRNIFTNNKFSYETIYPIYYAYPIRPIAELPLVQQ